MKSRLKKGLILVSVLLCSNAFAAFDGDYDIVNWSQVLDGGAIDLGSAPDGITLTSASGGASANTSFSIAVAAAGTLSFDWAYSTADNNTNRDPFGYFLNGSFTSLVETGGGPKKTQSGAASLAVNAGDMFGFSLQSTTGNAAVATTSISGFNGPSVVVTPSAVPLPPSLALLLTALGAVGMIHRRGRPLIAAAS